MVDDKIRGSIHPDFIRHSTYGTRFRIVFKHVGSAKVYDVKKFPDERGSFCEIMREDWGEFHEGEFIKQANLSMSYPGMIRAWHRHLKGQVDCFIVVRGAMKICAYDDRENSTTKSKLVEIVASEERIQVVRIPGFYWHGTKTISSWPSLTVYFVSRAYDHKNPDEERRPWNDPKIIDPESGSRLNGKNHQNVKVRKN